jgi:hypothetical protein
MDIGLDTHITISPEVMLQEISGEAVLLDLKSESYFGLDAVGTRIWRLVEQDGHLKAVYSELLAEYDVDPARLEIDLKQLIGQLADAGLVDVRTADARKT